MAFRSTDNLFFENATILYRNFQGLEKRSPTGIIVNEEGSRNFSVIIDDPDTAARLKEDGWNVKIRMPREDGDTTLNYLTIRVRFDRVPPKVWLVTTRNGQVTSKNQLDESTIDQLDQVDIVNVDLEVNPYHHKMDDGITAYLREGFFTIAESRFADKYRIDDNADLPWE